MNFKIIVTHDVNRGIGHKGLIPWRILRDIKFFRYLTTESATVNAVIMGRKTWESFPPNLRPLANRINIVITRNKEYELPDGVLKCKSLKAAIECLKHVLADNIFVIGGGEIYREAIIMPECTEIISTVIESKFTCDVFFPAYIHLIRKTFLLDAYKLGHNHVVVNRHILGHDRSY